MFDTFGKFADLGTPDMSPFLGKYGRSTAVFKQPLDVEKTKEGLFGGWLPIVSYRYTEAGGGAGCHTPRTPCPGHRDRTFNPCDPAQNQCDAPAGAAPPAGAASPPNEIEFTAVPVEDTSGSIELAVYFRVLRIDVASNAVLDAKYYQTFAYSASGGTPAKGQPAGSKTAQRFYSAIAAQQDYWEKTMAAEGAMVVDLPVASGTDGSMLANQSLHSIARDMISRIGAATGTGHGYFPQYGVSGVYAKASNHGFEDTFQASFTMALEWGCFEYARGLLHNWLSYYLTPDLDDEGFTFTGINYRGPEMPMHGRQLTLFALYHSYTRDPDGLLLQHFDRIQGLVAVLRRIRAKALTLPKDHAAYGMPAGNDEADLGGSSIECGTLYGEAPGDCQTELPYISVAAEMARGFGELGAVWVEIGTAAGRSDVVAEGHRMLNESGMVHADLLTSMARSTIPSVNGSANGVACRPHVAGWTCNGIRSHPVGRTDYTYPTLDVYCMGRTYPEAFYSGVLPADAVSDIVDWAAKNDGVFTVPRQWCTFTSHGWGYGLLQHDYIEQFLVFTFAVSAHAQTRGTWTAAECIGGLDRDAESASGDAESASGYAAPSQTVVPTLIKWMMLFEDPVEKQLWIGKGMPREWLLPGKSAVSLERSPTRYGRLSFALQAASATSIRANITLPADFKWPTGGLKLRLRAPGVADGKRIKSVTVGGASWASFNATEETIAFATAAVAALALQSIVATLG